MIGSRIGGEDKREGRPAAYPPPGVYPISYSRGETFFRGPLPSYRTLLEPYTEKAQMCPPLSKYSDQTSPILAENKNGLTEGHPLPIKVLLIP